MSQKFAARISFRLVMGLLASVSFLKALNVDSVLIAEQDASEVMRSSDLLPSGSMQALDAIIPASAWVVSPDSKNWQPNPKQVQKLMDLLLDDDGRSDRVCGYRWLNATGDSEHELFVVTDPNGRNYCGTAYVVRRGTDAYLFQQFDASAGVELASAVRDLNGDGIPELVLGQTYTISQDVRCKPEWQSIYQWNGNKYVAADAKFPSFYRQRLQALEQAISNDDLEPVSPERQSVNEEERSCEYMERDRIRRFLHIDDKAGLDRALGWVTSSSDVLRDRAVEVLSHIKDDRATKALQTLSGDPDPVVSADAKEALAEANGAAQK